MKTDLFQSCGHSWVFQIGQHIECSTLTASSFKIWNSSTGIPPPPLALFVVMLSKAHLTSHSRMSESRWVIIPSWLSGSWRSFLYSSSVYSCHLFLISSSSVSSIPFLSFIEPIFDRHVPLVSLIFLKRSLVFPILFLSSISLHWSLRKAFLSFLAILWNSAFRCLYLSFSPLLTECGPLEKGMAKFVQGVPKALTYLRLLKNAIIIDGQLRWQQYLLKIRSKKSDYFFLLRNLIIIIIFYSLLSFPLRAYLVAQTVKNLPAMPETWVRSLS